MRHFDDMGGRDIFFAGGHLVYALLWLAVVIAAIVLVVLGIRWLLRQGGAASVGGGSAAPRPDDPVEILRQRYAKGEIDDEEFNRRRTMLGG